MTHQENLSAIRSACVAANPEIKTGMCKSCERVFDLMYVGELCKCEDYIIEGSRPLTLPDVLLALGNGYAASGEGNVLKFGNQAMAGRSVWGFWEIGEGVKWNLRLPLSGQSEETVAYLANILSR